MSRFPKIKVFGIGSAGIRIIDRMLGKQYNSVEYYAVDDDYNALKLSHCENKIQIPSGSHESADYDFSANVTLKNKSLIADAVKGADIVILTAGMGGGMGSAATPIIADATKQNGICTVAVVHTPFAFEGEKRLANAQKGLKALKEKANMTLVIPCEKARQCSPENAPISEAMKLADEMIIDALDTVIAPMTVQGMINPDYEDVLFVLKESANAFFGTGIVNKKEKAGDAVKRAMNCPMTDTTIENVKSIILYVEGGDDFTLDDMNEIATYIAAVAESKTNLLFAANINSKLTGQIKVSVLGTKNDDN